MNIKKLITLCTIALSPLALNAQQFSMLDISVGERVFHHQQNEIKILEKTDFMSWVDIQKEGFAKACMNATIDSWKLKDSIAKLEHVKFQAPINLSSMTLKSSCEYVAQHGFNVNCVVDFVKNERAQKLGETWEVGKQYSVLKTEDPIPAEVQIICQLDSSLAGLQFQRIEKTELSLLKPYEKITRTVNKKKAVSHHSEVELHLSEIPDSTGEYSIKEINKIVIN